MALVITRGEVVDGTTGGPAPAGSFVVTERLYWDETKTRLLPEGDLDARFLAYAEGTVIPASVARTVGIVVTDPEPEAKMAPRPRDKAVRRRVNKAAGRDIAPGVVADTSLDGEANVLVTEPATPLRNGVDK